jgi:thioredoxin 1
VDFHLRHPQSELNAMSRRLLCCLLPALLLAAGCNEGPTTGRPLGNSPDGVVEVLTISSDGKIEHVEGKFLEAIKRPDSKMVLVDCWAEWCGPCKKLGPVLEEIKLSWGDQLEVVKVDVDQNPDIASHLGANAIPDVRIYRSGVQIGEFVGLMPKAEIEAYLKSLK